MMDADKTYNGWTNWETWHTALLADNEEQSYKRATALAERCAAIRRGEVKNKVFDLKRAADAFKRLLAPQWKATRDFAKENAREFGGGWGEPIDPPNWGEIAEHFMQTADENK